MDELPVDLLDSAHQLTISSPGRKPAVRLANASDDLIQAAQSVESQPYAVKDTILCGGIGPLAKVSSIGMLNQKARKLEECIAQMQESLHAISDQSEAYIITQIMHLDKADVLLPDVQSMLRHHR